MRLRVLLPRARRRRGLGGLSRRRFGALAALLGAAVLVVLLTRGSDDEPRAPARAPAATTATPSSPPRLAIGLSELNPHLIAPGTAPDGFGQWRDRVDAIRPQWFRLLVDWSKLQPAPGVAPSFEAVEDGCLRGLPPCAAYSGLRDRLRALRARQAADGGWQVVISVYGAPAWAKDAAPGCPEGGGTIRREPYESFLRALADVAEREGVDVAYWSPWNEPNHPTFLGPQRAACDAASPTLSAAAYAELVRAAGEALPDAELMVGEVAGYDRPRREATGAAEFAAALPRDVACAGRIWAQHAYVGRGSGPLAADREAGGHAKLLAAIKQALDGHGCGQPHRIWITETGAIPSERSCMGMDAALRAWEDDPRVDVAVQYTFRRDTEFPVGLADPGLTELAPAYEAWLAWGGSREPSDPPPPPPCDT